MARHRHVALLRGINVGGKGLIKMADLRAAFEELGFTDVSTYIASGNVLFSSTSSASSAVPRLTRAIETAVGARFGCGTPVVVIGAAELARVMSEAPAGFGADADRYRHDVLFVKAPLVARDVLAEIPARDGVDTVAAGSHALYYRRLISEDKRSLLPKLMQRPIYQQLTARNWNTTSKLAALIAA
jgi:uncharacterized protein (DUF1697 family)